LFGFGLAPLATPLLTLLLIGGRATSFLKGDMRGNRTNFIPLEKVFHRGNDSKLPAPLSVVVYFCIMLRPCKWLASLPVY
jgi:hypothetical protein